MSEDRKRPLAYDFDEEWDVEKALEDRQKSYQTASDRIQQQLSSVPYNPQAPKTYAPSRRPTRKRKMNIKGWLILGGIGLVALMLLIGLIFFIVGLFSSDEEPTTVTTTEATKATEPTESREDLIAEVLEKADRLAASYDYDNAIAALHEFGGNWAQQPELKEAQTRYLEAQSSLVRWEDTTTIPHIFFRALIVDTDRAFDGDEDELTYNQYMVTVDEFRDILQSLYDGGYVLVNMHDMVKTATTESGGTEFAQGDIYLPEGKKPIVLSQEDVNYYQYRVDGPDEDALPDAEGDGFACQLLLDQNGELTCKYVDADGNIHYGAYDLVPILEEFIAEHPDFSYRGARGMLAVTGSEGVFGFQTHPDWEETLGNDAYMEQIRQAQEVATALKERGWEIACQSYSKISYADNDADTIAANLKKWENQVAPIVGKTDILVYPYGSDIAGVESYSGDKFNVLYNAGYRFFCNMDATEYWVQLRSNYMRQARRVIDGYRLEHGADMLDDLFDAAEIIDEDRPRPVPTLY